MARLRVSRLTHERRCTTDGDLGNKGLLGMGMWQDSHQGRERKHGGEMNGDLSGNAEVQTDRRACADQAVA